MARVVPVRRYPGFRSSLRPVAVPVRVFVGFYPPCPAPLRLRVAERLAARRDRAWAAFMPSCPVVRR